VSGHGPLAAHWWAYPARLVADRVRVCYLPMSVCACSIPRMSAAAQAAVYPPRIVGYGAGVMAPRSRRDDDDAPITDDQVTYWISVIARDARAAAGLLQRQVSARGDFDQGRISDFENRRSRPRNIDRMVEAYAAALGVRPVELWQRAIARWAQASSGPAVPVTPRSAEPPRIPAPPGGAPVPRRADRHSKP
jgi:hypothetical protein